MLYLSLLVMTSIIYSSAMYCRFGNFREGFKKIESSQNGEITLLFVNMAKSCLSHDFLMLQICLLTLYAKIKFLQKFPNLQCPKLVIKSLKHGHCHVTSYSRTSMARTLMAHSPGVARTSIMVPTGHPMHNPPWMAGTTLG